MFASHNLFSITPARGQSFTPRQKSGKSFLAFSLTALVMATSACPGGDGATPDGGDGDGDGDVDTDVNDALRNAYRNYINDCLADSFGRTNPLLDKLEPDFAEQNFDADELIELFIDPALNNDAVIVDETAAAACTAELEAQATACEDDLGEAVNAACEGVFVGTIADGETCAIGAECVNPICELDDDDCLVCSPIAAAGESCANDVQCDFREDLYCSDSDVCTKNPGLGDGCDDENAFCSEGYCNGEGQCESAAGLGENCEATDFVCEDDLECEDNDAGGFECKAAIPPLGAGDECQPLENDSCTLFETARVCVDLDDDGTSNCTEITAGAEGASCDGTIFAQNAGANWCLNAYSTHYCNIPGGATEGTCDLRPVIGESCADTSCRDWALCPRGVDCLVCDDADVCRAPPAIGEACPQARCEDGATCDDDGMEQQVCVSDTPDNELCMP